MIVLGTLSSNVAARGPNALVKKAASSAPPVAPMKNT